MNRSDFNDRVREANALNSPYTADEGGVWHIDADIAWVAYCEDRDTFDEDDPVSALVEYDGPWWVRGNAD